MAEVGQRAAAEVLGALSLATDLANDHPMETALRTGLLAAALARELGLAAGERDEALYIGLLRYLGCTSSAHLEAGFTGDDIEVRKLFLPVDLENRGEVAQTTLLRLGRGAGAARRLAAVARAVARSGSHLAKVQAMNCEAGERLARRMGMGAAVAAGLAQVFERWDGRGGPQGLGGEDIAAPVRVAQVAAVATLHLNLGGLDAAREVVRRRRGGQLAPAAAETFLSRGAELVREIEEPSAWERFVAAAATAAPARLEVEAAAAAFADFADLKSVFTLGHSAGVARLAERAAELFGLDAGAARTLRLAGLLHDLGRVSVPTGIWEKPGPLDAPEWERVRLHAYFTDRVLSRAPALAAAARVAAGHHERLDASGYPKSRPAALLDPATRILAAADLCHALSEARPHRPALGEDEARAVVEGEIEAGRLDHRAAAAVMQAAGKELSRPPPWPAELSDREVEVLRLVAAARTNKEIARELGISARTVQHHVSHIYDKIGVTTRVGAALFALEHDLLPHPACGAPR